MSDDELIALVMSIHARGWRIELYVEGGHRFVRLAADAADSRDPAMSFVGLEDRVCVHPTMTADELISRLFCMGQFLIDHEWRERFMVGDKRPFDAHEPESVTGRQHDWFVEAQSARQGF